MKYILLTTLLLLSLSINAQKRDTISINSDEIQRWTSSEVIKNNKKQSGTYYVIYKNKSFSVSEQVYRKIDTCKRAIISCSLILIDKQQVLIKKKLK